MRLRFWISGPRIGPIHTGIIVTPRDFNDPSAPAWLRAMEWFPRVVFRGLATAALLFVVWCVLSAVVETKIAPLLR